MPLKNWLIYKKLFNSPETAYKKLLNSPEKVKPDFTEIVEKCTAKHQFSSKELNKFDLTDTNGTLHFWCGFCSGPMYKFFVGSRCKNCQYLCHTSCELDVQNTTTCPQNNKVVEKSTAKHQFDSKEFKKFDLTDADGTLHIRCEFCSGPMYKGSRCKNCQYLCHTSCELDVQNSTTCPQNNKVKTKPIIYNP